MSPEEISDRMEIQQLLTRYCHAVDAQDWAEFARLFSADAVLDYRAFGGPCCGVAEMAGFLGNILRTLAGSQHTISTSLIAFDGATASGRTAAQVMMINATADGGRHVSFIGLWYRDSLRKTPDGWRIAARTQEYGWVHNIPPA